MKSDVYRGKLQAQVQPNAAKLKLSAERTTNKEQLRPTAVKPGRATPGRKQHLVLTMGSRL